MISKLQSSLVTFCLFIASPSNFNELVAKIYLMVTACGQRCNIISFVPFTGQMSEAYFWRGMFVNL